MPTRELDPVEAYGLEPEAPVARTNLRWRIHFAVGIALALAAATTGLLYIRVVRASDRAMGQWALERYCTIHKLLHVWPRDTWDFRVRAPEALAEFCGSHDCQFQSRPVTSDKSTVEVQLTFQGSFGGSNTVTCTTVAGPHQPLPALKGASTSEEERQNL